MFKPMTGIQVDKFYPPADWKDNNNNWIDIRNGAENNTITLLYGVKSDYSAYSLFGLVVQVSSGTYDVYIDDVLVGSGVTSNTQYDIDFSNIATSYGTATTPETLTLHKIVIKPTTSSETITQFRCERTTGATNYQYQGMMWCHFELDNSIVISGMCNSGNYYVNTIFYALTAKGDTITSSDLTNVFRRCQKLQYIPTIKSSSSMNLYGTFTACDNCTIKIAKFVFETANRNNILFLQCNGIEKIVANNPIKPTNSFISARKLKMLPKFATTDWVVANTMDLYPTKLDLSSMTSLKQVLIGGTSTYTARGIKGLKVSSFAPFGGGSPQINISYTGLDRNALVELFNSLPTVTGSQTLNCAGATGTADLTEADKQIATDKGWALTLS